jgi:hypothetical protein
MVVFGRLLGVPSGVSWPSDPRDRQLGARVPDSLPVGFPTGHCCRREKSGTGPGGSLGEDGGSLRRASSRMSAPHLFPGRWTFGSRRPVIEGREVGAPASRRSVMPSRDDKSHESIGSLRLRPQDAGTDLRMAQSPEVAGHRDLLVLRAGARDVKNGRRAWLVSRRAALRGGKALEGRKTPRAVPILVIGKREGSKPSRGWETLEAERTGDGTPGPWIFAWMSLKGRKTPRVAGAAQDSGRDVEVNPEGKSKPMGGSGATAPDGGSAEHREAVETARRAPGTEYRLLGPRAL